MTTSMNIAKYILFACILVQTVYAAKNVIYWGQESQHKEKRLKEYCDGTYDIIVIGFVYEFPTPSLDPNSSYPALNFASHCETPYSQDEPFLLICPEIGDDITTCQRQGIQIYISIGGGVGRYGFSSDDQGVAFANRMWNMFMGGSDPNIIRPFGNAIIDGVDLDIEGGGIGGYTGFIGRLRQYFALSQRKYYISSAPQCFFPDGRLGPNPGTALSTAWFDYVWIQFYNNHCGVHNYGTSSYNFDKWANWARTGSINPNVKLLIGVPASPQASGNGYVTLDVLRTIHSDTMRSYGDIYDGIMLWDLSNSEINNNYGNSVAVIVHGSSPSPVPTKTTTGVQGTTTTGAQGSTTTTGVKSTTTGVQGTTTTGVQGTTTTGVQGSTSSTSGLTVPSGGSQSPVKGCTLRNMRCVSGAPSMYQTCTNGDTSNYWANQTCGAGLSCVASGDFIYCGYTPSVPATPSTPAVPATPSTPSVPLTTSTVPVTSSMPPQPSTSAPSTTAQSTPVCHEGDQRCSTSSTYQTCSKLRDGSTYWATAQNCQSGLTCHPNGVNIYCY